MPAVAPSYLDSVVYLYPSVDAARDGDPVGGTGVLVAVPSRHEGKVWLRQPPHESSTDGIATCFIRRAGVYPCFVCEVHGSRTRLSVVLAHHPDVNREAVPF